MEDMHAILFPTMTIIEETPVDEVPNIHIELGGQALLLGLIKVRDLER